MKPSKSLHGSKAICCHIFTYSCLNWKNLRTRLQVRHQASSFHPPFTSPSPAPPKNRHDSPATGHCAALTKGIKPPGHTQKGQFWNVTGERAPLTWLYGFSCLTHMSVASEARLRAQVLEHLGVFWIQTSERGGVGHFPLQPSRLLPHTLLAESSVLQEGFLRTEQGEWTRRTQSGGGWCPVASPISLEFRGGMIVLLEQHLCLNCNMKRLFWQKVSLLVCRFASDVWIRQRDSMTSINPVSEVCCAEVSMK